MKEESNLSRVLGTICYDEPFEVIAVFHRNMSLPFSVEDTVIPENSCYQTSSATEAIPDEENRAQGNHSGCYPSFSIISTKSVRS